MTNKLIIKATGIGAAAVAVAKPALIMAQGDLQKGVDAAGKGLGGASSVESVFNTVAKTLIFIVGAVAVIMLIVGGLRYVLSGGNKESVEGAKNTILYALIGVIVALMAFAAVNFVTGRFGK